MVVMTNLPIQKVLQKPDVAGRMVRWAVELSEFDIQYEPRGSIKGQVYANFVAELSSGGGPQEVELGSQWMLYHTTPQSSTMETPFSLVYASDAMIPVEIHESSPRFLSFVT